MSTPITPDQIAKLPVWARNYIRDLEMATTNLRRTIAKFSDTDTTSPIYAERGVCGLGEDMGPAPARNYIQSPDVYINHAGVTLRVNTSPSSQRQHAAIALQWWASTPFGDDIEIPMLVHARQSVFITTPNNLGSGD